MTEGEGIYEWFPTFSLRIYSKLFVHLNLLEVGIYDDLIRIIIIDLLLSSLRLTLGVEVGGKIFIKSIHQKNILHKEWHNLDTKSLNIV